MEETEITTNKRELTMTTVVKAVMGPPAFMAASGLLSTSKFRDIGGNKKHDLNAEIRER